MRQDIVRPVLGRVLSQFLWRSPQTAMCPDKRRRPPGRFCLSLDIALKTRYDPWFELSCSESALGCSLSSSWSVSPNSAISPALPFQRMPPRPTANEAKDESWALSLRQTNQALVRMARPHSTKLGPTPSPKSNYVIVTLHMVTYAQHSPVHTQSCITTALLGTDTVAVHSTRCTRLPPSLPFIQYICCPAGISTAGWLHPCIY